jgi:MFS family permease
VDAVQQGLWRDRAFLLFYAARMASVAGSTITAVVLPILVYQRTGSAAQTAFTVALNAIPYLLFGLVAGAVADRVDRRRLMVSTSVAAGLLIAAIPIADQAGVLRIWMVYAATLGAAVMWVWFDAANFGALPSLVGRQRVVEANSIVTSGYTAIGIIGPAVGGLLAATIGPAWAIMIDAASYLLAAALLQVIPRPFNAERGAPRPGSVVRGVVADIREGLDFLWHHAIVRTMVLAGFGNSFTGGALQGLVVVYAVRALGLGEQDGRIGALFSAGAVGALGATLLLPFLVRRVPVGRITLVGLIVHPLIVVGVALAPSFPVALVAYLLWYGCFQLIIVNGISVRQMVTPDRLQSRVNATGRLIAWGGTPFGATVGGLLADALGVRPALILLALPVTCAAVLAWVSPLRRRGALEMAEVEVAPAAGD